VNEIKCDPELFSFKGMRKLAMKRAWELADEAEKEGKPMKLGDFGKFLKKAYDEVKEAQKRCLVEEKE